MHLSVLMPLVKLIDFVLVVFSVVLAEFLKNEKIKFDWNFCKSLCSKDTGNKIIVLQTCITHTETFELLLNGAIGTYEEDKPPLPDDESLPTDDFIWRGEGGPRLPIDEDGLVVAPPLSMLKIIGIEKIVKKKNFRRCLPIGIPSIT